MNIYIKTNTDIQKQLKELTKSVNLNEYKEKCKDYFSVDEDAIKQAKECDLENFQYNQLKNLPPDGFCNLQLYDRTVAKSQILSLDKYQRYHQEIEKQYNIVMTDHRLQNKALRDHLYDQYINGGTQDMKIDDL